MLLLIDNYDSFTHNVAHYFRELGKAVKVVANDALSLADIDHWQPSHLVISPGPCTPKESGISMEVIRTFGGRIPVLGICLGHQCIAQHLGASIVRASEVVHGKTSAVFHNGSGVFEALPSPFQATRYHSLVIDEATLPDHVEVNAWTADKTIMGIRVLGKRSVMEGVQFHPEAILTEHGHHLFENFLRLENTGAQTR